MIHPYNGIRAVVTTKHKKEKLIAPIFQKLGIELLHFEWDTDQLGTFSTEIPRALTQHETVIKKARVGMARIGHRYGVASEGSVGPDISLPILNSTVEAITWVDDVNGFQLVEYERGLDVVAVKESFANFDGIDEFLKRADFPNHGLILYPEGEKDPIYKGIRNRSELEAALDQCLKKSSKKIAVVESDLRAHMSPSRSAVIAKCAEKLVDRLSKLCPSCQLPGFGEIGRLSGLPCESCGEEVVTALKGNVLGCVKCEYKFEKLNGKTDASASSCLSCNP